MIYSITITVYEPILPITDFELFFGTDPHPGNKLAVFHFSVVQSRFRAKSP